MKSRKMADNERQQRKKVVIVAMTGQMLLDFTGPADVFSNANAILERSGAPPGYDISVVAPTPDKKIVSANGMEVSCTTTAMEVQEAIDTLIIAGNDYWEDDGQIYQPFYNWLSGIHEGNTRRIASVCAGAFCLAKVGLLNGRKATTHWEIAGELQKHYPLVDVNPNAFFTHDGAIYTSAGVSSGIDLCLALVEEDFGRDVAIGVARRLVFYLSRPGFQVQFGNLLPVYERSNIGRQLQAWLSDRLHQPLDVGHMAAHFNMSVRNLTRVLQKQTGMPPAKFIEKFRVEAARKYLEDTDISLERIAELCGLGGLVSMRRIFIRHLMTTPSDYRRAFRSALHTSEMNDLMPEKYSGD